MGLRPTLVWGAPLALVGVRRGRVDLAPRGVALVLVAARATVGGCVEMGCSLARLLVLRGFQEGVVLGAADHFVEGGAGGDHGVDSVFFFYLEVD